MLRQIKKWINYMVNFFVNRKDFYKSGSETLSFLLVVLISLSPFALNGWWFDDTAISSTYWEVQIRGISLLQFLWETILSWANINGRLAPLALVQIYSLHYWIHDVHVYRFCHILLVLIHISTFVWLLRKLKLDWNFIGLWLILLMGVFQARNFHDPIASYGFFLQTQGIFLTLAIVSLLTWRESLSNKWLILSSVLALTALLMYEINLVFYPIALGLLLIAPHSTQLKIRALVTLCIPLIPYALLTIYLRNTTDINYPGVKVGSTDLMLATYGKQFLAAFPGVFYFLQWKTEFPFIRLFSSFISSPLAWILLLASLYSTFRCVWANKLNIEILSLKNSELSIIALCLIFITPVFIAISSKYQLALTWGTGYLPVYYSYFGVALVLAALFSSATECFVSLRLPVVIVVAILITANFLVNRNVIDKMDEVHFEPQKSLAQALESGLLDKLHDGDSLKFESPVYQFMDRAFVYRHSGRKLVIDDGLVTNQSNSSLRKFILGRQKQPPYKWKLIMPNDVDLVYGEGWSSFEGTHRWSVSQRAVINLNNVTDKPLNVNLIFDLNTLKPRNVSLVMNGKPLDKLPTYLNGNPVHFDILGVNLAPGENNLIIETDVPAESPGKGDLRKLSFSISNDFLSKQK